MANFTLELDCLRLEQGVVSVIRVLWVMQVLLRLQHGSMFLPLMVWVKPWGPASAAVFLGMLLGLLLSLAQGFFAGVLL